MPPLAWVRAPAAAWSRVTKRYERTPWIVPSAVRFLDQVLNARSRILEFGAGSSTVWFCERVGAVASMEDDANWYERVTGELAVNRLTNYTLQLISAESYPFCVKQFPDSSLDLVLVDGNEAPNAGRLECLAAARSKVKPGGWLVLDDSDRPDYRHADELLPGWPVRRFAGLKPFPLIAFETSIFQRPTRPTGPERHLD